MSTNSRLPSLDAIRQQLMMLFDFAITCTPCPPPPDESEQYVVTVVRDDGGLEACFCADRSLVVKAGAAFTMLPVSEVGTNLQAGQISATVLDNFREIANVLSSLFNQPGTPHVKLQELYHSDTLPESTREAFQSASSYSHMQVAIDGYGQGRLSLYRCGALAAESDAEKPELHSTPPGSSPVPPIAGLSSSSPGAPFEVSPGRGVQIPGDSPGGLHRQEPPDVLPAHEAPPAPPRITTIQRVLVVEDDSSTRQLIRTLLGRAGHHVFEAGTARDALQILTRQRFDSLLVDIRLPDMTGVELVRQIRLNPVTSKIPVVICTAVADRDVVIEAASLKIAGYLLKPITAQNLLETVARVGTRLVPALEPPKAVATWLGISLHEYRGLLYELLEEFDEALASIRNQKAPIDGSHLEYQMARLGAAALQLGARSCALAADAVRQSALKKDAVELERYVAEFEAEVGRAREAAHGQFTLGSALRRIERRSADI